MSITLPTASCLATMLETIYESDYNLENFKLEIIDSAETIDETLLVLIRYELKGDLTKMPGILTKINNIRTKELRENLLVLWDDEMEEKIDRFKNISEETRTKIKHGLFICHSVLSKNLRREWLPNAIMEKTNDVEAEFYNIVECDCGKFEFMFENNAIPPPWKK